MKREPRLTKRQRKAIERAERERRRIESERGRMRPADFRTLHELNREYAVALDQLKEPR